MKNSHISLNSIRCISAWIAITISSHAATLTGGWEFSGNLNNQIGAGPSMTTTNWSPTYANVIIGGTSSSVIEVPALSNSQMFSFVNTIGANGNGALSNDFSIGWDVNFRDLQTFESLLQTNSANADDVDVFAQVDGQLPPGGAAGITGNTWFCIVLTSENNGAGTSQINIYVNGSQVSSTNAGTDSRYALSLGNNHIFTDDNNETGNAYLNSFALWDGALTSGDISILGAASSGGFSVPEPGVFTFAPILAAFAVLRRQRSEQRGRM